MREKIQGQLKRQLHWVPEEGVKAGIRRAFDPPQQGMGCHIGTENFFPTWVRVHSHVQKGIGQPVIEELWLLIRSSLSPEFHSTLRADPDSRARREAKTFNFAYAYGHGSLQ